MTVDGQRVDWRRYPYEPYAFHLPVPPGGKNIELTLIGDELVLLRAEIR